MQSDTGTRDTAKGSLRARQREAYALPKKGRKKVYIVSSAQNNTGLHEACWENLNALAEHDNAEIIVGSFTYNKAKMSAKGAKKTSKEFADDTEWWDERVEPYLVDTSVELAPGLVWCGELQVLPTAVNPISGLESYTGRSSSIIPHAKFAVQSVASPKHQGCKFIYTTGTVTLRNYIQKKAGQKAEFHHGYGALIVEVLSDGAWFVRQLNADSEGDIYDLDRKIAGGRVTYGHRPEALAWGDVHERQMECDMRELAWGPGGILDLLRPRRQVLHDLLDFRSQNHHDRKDPWKTYAKFVTRTLDVQAEVNATADFLAYASRPWCETAIAASNHNEAMPRWLKETDARDDPANAKLWLAATVAAYAALEAGDASFDVVKWAVSKTPSRPGKRVRWLRRDEEYLVCEGAHGGIELGMHGDVGANGARGGLAQFAKTGRKCIVGHSHVAGLQDGAMSVGVMGALDQSYNIGQSSWSQTFALVSPNGKRQLVTVWKGRWRA